jgi:membrane protein insertase Oxa1/YidC/SpoIIIJ
MDVVQFLLSGISVYWVSGNIVQLIKLQHEIIRSIISYGQFSLFDVISAGLSATLKNYPFFSL